MEIKVRVGKMKELDELEKLYDDLNDYLAAHTNYPGWRKGIYPTRLDAQVGIEEHTLFVATIDNKIVGTLILRHEQEKAYRTVIWQKDLKDEDVFVIYTFAVHPDYKQQGIGHRLLKFAEDYARENGAKSLRLDVYDHNLPAIKLYKECGFQYIQTVDLGLKEYGLDWFELYEKLILH